MAKRIDNLTDAQRARFGEWRDRWIAIGLRTGESDWATFEPAVIDCYRFAGLPPPKVFVRVSSPLVLALAAPIADHLLKRGVAVRDAVGGAVRDAVRGAVGGAVDDAVRDAVRDAVGGAVGVAVGVAVGGAVGGAVDDAVGVAVDDAVRDAVRGAVGGAVRGAVRVAVGVAVGVAVRDAVRGAVRNNWWSYIGGQFWVGGWWGSPAFVSYFREVCGLELPGDMNERALAYERTASSACWWWPHRDFVMVSERPTAIARDAEGRLHSEVGPAIVWPDGFGVWSWHGTTIPREWIEQRASVDVGLALTWQNIEQRRALAEIIGWARVLERIPTRVIDADKDPGIGTLLECDLPGAELSRFLKVKCGTGRDFVLSVPREMQTALEANAWTYGLGADEYRLEART